jgi:hypothetical protein
MKLRVSTFALVLIVSGCGFVSFARLTVNDPIGEQDVAFIKAGQTTFAEIVQKLGAPDELNARDHGAVAVYHFRDARYSRLNLGWPLHFFLPVSPDLILAAGGLGTDQFLVTFDERWVAQDRAFAFHTAETRSSPWPF